MCRQAQGKPVRSSFGHITIQGDPIPIVYNGRVAYRSLPASGPEPHIRLVFRYIHIRSLAQAEALCKARA